MKGTGNCEINDEIDMTELIRRSIDFVSSVIGTDYDEFFNQIKNGMIYCIPQANIEVAIINNPFSSLAYSVDSMIIPTNFKKAIDNNEVFDISLEFNVDGKMATGKVTALHKIHHAYNQGTLV